MWRSSSGGSRLAAGPWYEDGGRRVAESEERDDRGVTQVRDHRMQQPLACQVHGSEGAAPQCANELVAITELAFDVFCVVIGHAVGLVSFEKLAGSTKSSAWLSLPRESASQRQSTYPLYIARSMHSITGPSES